MSADVAVVGAGLSGVACARELEARGVRVRLLDRGHVAGGRMASRTLWGRPTDLGASYLTVDDPDFAAVVEDWASRGLAHEWTDTFTVLGADRTSSSGPVRWGAPRGLRSLVTDLADGLDVRRDELTSIDGIGADAVVLAMPDPQAARLVGEHPVAARLDREWEPVLALAARWPSRTWDGVADDGRFEGAFVDGDDDVAWIADDGRRRGDDAPVLVVHSTPGRARRHLADPAAGGPALVAATRRLLSVAEPEEVHVHRWTYARPTGEREDPWGLAEGDRLVGVCGDGWGAKPRVETAWLSGRDLGRALADRLVRPGREPG